MHITGKWTTREVEINGVPLHPDESIKAYNHSPDGFNWGYAGSGPAQLALALLMQVTDTHTALLYHQQFKIDFVLHLPQADFDVSFDVAGWLKKRVQKEEACTR